MRDKAGATKYLPFKSNIERQIQRVSDLAEQGDLVLIAFSGHGRHGERKSDICPTGVNQDQLPVGFALL